MSNFPIVIDTLVTPDNTKYQDDPAYLETAIIGALNTAVTSIETKVGIDGSADTTSLDYKTSRLTTKGDILTHDGTNPIRLPVGTNGYMVVADNTQATGLNYIAPTSGGTVTSSAFTNGNGVNGVVSNPTTTPTLALSFPNSGLQKSNGTALSTATPGTDYYAPGATDVAVADGGTGRSTATAYAPLFGGTTATGAHQSGTVGTSGQVLTSNGAGALPTFQTPLQGRTTAVATMANPASNTVANTTNYGTTITFSGGLVIGYINGAIQGVDMNGTIGVEWSANGTSGWTIIMFATAFAYFANSFSAGIISPVEGAFIAPGYIRTFATTLGTSMSGSGLTLGTTYFRY